MKTNNEIYSLIDEELLKSREKFPTWPDDPLHAVAVLGEEFGELTKSILEFVYEDKSTMSDIREEAIQTAAMAVRFLASLEEYDYSPSTQHSQGNKL